MLEVTDWIWIWLAITVISLILEFITVEMASIWFACGGIASLILSACSVMVEVQVIVFIVISLALLLSLRKFALKILNKKDIEKTNADRVIGKKIKLITAIEDSKPGTIKIDGVVWNVISEDGENIHENENVEIVSLKGNKYIVKRGEK